jgi:hypothetical protein
MRRTTLAAAIALFALAMVASANEKPEVRVVLEPAVDRVIARYTFEKPFDSFRVAYPSDEIRDKTWKVLTAGIERNGTLFTHKDGAPFQTLDVEVSAWNDGTNATYPCLFKVGDHGLGFYAAYFIGEPQLFATTLEIAPAKNRIVEGFPLGGNVWRIDDGAREPAHNYAYIGLSGDVVESRFARFVLPGDVIADLSKRIRTNIDGVLAFYTRKLARPLQIKPLVLLAANPATRGAGFQGDVTNGPAVALRVFGRNSQAFDERSDITDHFVAHEGAHFWDARGDAAPAWTWEGVAEYMALEARIAVTNRFSKAQRREHIERTLNECVANLLAKPFSGDRSNATYVCGQTLYWLADAGEKRRSKGRGDIFTLWRRLLDKAEANGGTYNFNQVLAIVAPDEPAKAALSLFLVENGAERWQQLPALAAPLGIVLESGTPTPDSLRRLALFHILDQYCTGSRGWWTQDDYLKLDTGNRCGPLSGDPDIDSLNGYSLLTDMPKAFAAATEACAKNGDIALTRTGAPTKLVAPCTKPMPAPPPAFSIRATP